MTIQTASQALEFVRLFTTCGRWMFSGIADYAEVVAADQRDWSRFALTRQDFAKCCRPASVKEYTRSDGTRSFEIKRVLVASDYTVYRVTEVVGQGGDWRITGKELLPLDGRKLGSFLLFDH